jgi:hypothetical protein
LEDVQGNSFVTSEPKRCYDLRGIRQLLVVGSVIFTLVRSPAAQNPRLDPHPFIVHMAESQQTSEPSAGPNNLSNCVIVLPDGHFKLVLFRQESIGGKGTMDTFESSLGQKEIQILRGLLDSNAVSKLPPYVGPNLPIGSNGFKWFEAEISRESNVQRVGYFVWWGGSAPTNPEGTKREWQESMVALQPLVEWFRALKSMGGSIPPAKWRRLSRQKSDPCEMIP